MLNIKNIRILVPIIIGALIVYMPSPDDLILNDIKIKLELVSQTEESLYYEINIENKSKTAIAEFRYNYKKTKSSWNKSSLVVHRADLLELNKNLEFIIVMRNDNVLMTREFDVLDRRKKRE